MIKASLRFWCRGRIHISALPPSQRNAAGQPECPRKGFCLCIRRSDTALTETVCVLSLVPRASLVILKESILKSSSSESHVILSESNEPAFFLWHQGKQVAFLAQIQPSFSPLIGIRVYTRTPRTASCPLIGPGTKSPVRRMYLDPLGPLSGYHESDRTPKTGPAGPDTAAGPACLSAAVITPGMWIVIMPLTPRGPRPIISGNHFTTGQILKLRQSPHASPSPHLSSA